MTYDVFHWSEYRYSGTVQFSSHTLHMVPRPLPGQRVLRESITFVPQPARVSEFTDYFGNRVTAFRMAEPHAGMHLKVRSRVEVDPTPVPDANKNPSPPWEEVRADAFAGKGGAEIQDFLFPSAYVPHLEAVRTWAAPSFAAGRPVALAALDIVARIFDEFTFDNFATTVSTPLATVLHNRRGVCQDFAHLGIACLRSHGIPARYLSGYLRTDPPPGRAKVFGADASHAWFAFHHPALGWVGVDPTNNCIVGNTYITLGWGRDYGDVALIRGSLSGGGDHTLLLSVDVSPVVG